MNVELVPGISAVEVPSPFEARWFELLHEGADVAAAPPTVRVTAPAWSSVLRFPSEGPQPPSSFAETCWVVRVEARRESGRPVFTFESDQPQVHDQRELRAEDAHVDLVVPQLADWPAVLLRVGDSTPCAVRLHAIRCFRVQDDAPLALPAGARLTPTAQWNRFFGTPGDDLVWRLRYRRFTRLSEPTLMQWLDGIQLLLVPGSQISQAIYTSGVYEPSTSVVLRELLRPGDTFVDIGANNGFFSLLAARWVGPQGRVLAFEPSAREFAQLNAHVQLNALSNVETYKLAIGASEGTGVLHVADHFHSGLNTLEPSFMYPDVKEDHAERVRIVALDDFLPAAGVTRVAAMKIDVEGFEPAVIEGARGTIARDRPALIVEVGGAALEPSHPGRRRMEEILAASGYALAAIEGETGRVVRVATMQHAAENLLAAPAGVIERVIAQIGRF